MALVVWFALLRPRYSALQVRWAWVIVAYALAKILEANDHTVFELTGQWISGHTLKHFVAAFAAVPVIVAIGRLLDSRQNAAGLARTGRSPI